MKAVVLLLAFAVLETGCITCSDKAPRSAEWTKCLQDLNQMNFEAANRELMNQVPPAIDPGPIPIPVLPQPPEP